MCKNIVLDEIQQFNLELILNDSYKPLKGFMIEKDYLEVLTNYKLSTGEYFPFPIVLQICNEIYKNISNEKEVYLVDQYNKRLAILSNINFYKPNIEKEYKIYNKDFIPYFYKFGIEDNSYYHIGGKVTRYIDNNDIKITNKYLDRYLTSNNILSKGNNCVILSNKLHLDKDINEKIDIIFSFIYPFVSNKNKYIQYKKHYTLKTIYINFPYEEEEIIDKTRLYLLKEIILCNYQCKTLFSNYKFQYKFLKNIQKNIFISKDIHIKKGLCILITGYSGSGKTSLANKIRMELNKEYSRNVTIFDSDLNRNNIHLFKISHSISNKFKTELCINYLTIQHLIFNNIVIITAIIPLKKSRHLTKFLVNKYGKFLYIHLNTSLNICKQRDPKKLYKLYNQGIIKNLVGLDIKYENDYENVIKFDNSNIDENLNKIIELIRSINYIL